MKEFERRRCEPQPPPSLVRKYQTTWSKMVTMSVPVIMMLCGLSGVYAIFGLRKTHIANLGTTICFIKLTFMVPVALTAWIIGRYARYELVSCNQSHNPAMLKSSTLRQAVWIATGLLLFQSGCGGSHISAQGSTESVNVQAGQAGRRPTERSTMQLNEACSKVLPPLKDLLVQLSDLRLEDATEPLVLSFHVVRKIGDHEYEALVLGRQVIVQTMLVNFETTGQATLSVVRENSKRVELSNGFIRDVPFFREAVSSSGAWQLSPLDVLQQQKERNDGIQQLQSTVVLRLLASNQQKFSNEELTKLLGQSADDSLLTDVRTIDGALNQALKNKKNALQYAIATQNHDAIALFLGTEVVQSSIRHDGAGLIPALADLNPSTDFFQKTYTQLVELGAQIDDVDLQGSAAIHHALTGGKTSLIDWLIKSGANVNVADASGNTPLMLAVKFNSRSEVYDQLLKAGAKPSLGDSEGNTPLHFAASQTSSALLETLLGHTDKVNVQNSKGRTPLHVACEKYHYEGIPLLLEKGANRCAKDNDGTYPLGLLEQPTHRGQFATVRGIQAGDGSFSTISTPDSGWIALTTDIDRNVMKRCNQNGDQIWTKSAPLGIKLLQSVEDERFFAISGKTSRDSMLISFDQVGKELWKLNIGRSRPRIREDGSFGFISELGVLEVRDAENRSLCSLNLGRWASAITPFQFDNRLVVVANEKGSRAKGIVAYSIEGKELWRFSPHDENAETDRFITIGTSGRVYAGFSSRKRGQAVYCLDAEGNELWNAPIAYLSSNPIELPTGEAIITSDKAQCFDETGNVVWSVPGTFGEVKVLPNQNLAFLIGTDFGNFVRVTLDNKSVQTMNVGRFQNFRFFNEGIAHLHRDGKIRVIDLLCW